MSSHHLRHRRQRLFAGSLRSCPVTEGSPVHRPRCSSRHWLTRLRKYLVVVLHPGLITLAGRGFKTAAVKHADFPAGIANEVALL